MTHPIKFYSTADEYGEFSNFAAYPIKIGKQVWPTSEHYFQAMKFKDKAEQGEDSQSAFTNAGSANGTRPQADTQTRLGISQSQCDA